MNLNIEEVSGLNGVVLNKIEKESLKELKIELNSDTIVPNDNELIVYIDESNLKGNLKNRKKFILKLNDKLNKFENVGDELVIKFFVEKDKAFSKTFVNRKIGIKNNENYILKKSVTEELEGLDIELFGDMNYIYTNYENAIITLTYINNDNLITPLTETNSLSTNNESLSWDDIYFKDCFTKAGNNINLEVNNASIDCITSRNNKFSLDSDGNLVVNSITTNQSSQQFTKEQICNFIYPIGSVYMSINSTSPANLFGGTWSRINGYYLYAGTGGTTTGSNTSGAPSNNTSGSTALTINQMPSHTHNIRYGLPDTPNSGCIWALPQNGIEQNQALVFNNNVEALVMKSGGNQGHTHTLNSHTHSVTPLRYEVYAWRRTA